MHKTTVKKFRDNLVLILMAQAGMLTNPAIVHAAWEDYHPINFTQPIRAERGEISPTGPESIYLSDEDGCKLAKEDWGWANCVGLDRIIIGGAPLIDTLVLNDPVSEGFVKLDDFFASGASDEIEEMEEELRESHRQQSQRTGKKIEFLGWRIFPKADKVKNVIYYAYNSSWDGESQINIKTMLLDRYGYVVIDVVPRSDDLDEAAVEMVVDQTIASYKPDPLANYAAYEEGDKLAAYGGLGVLATVLGVKYGKVASVGLVAILAIFLKKGGFLLALPFLWLGRLLFRRKRS